MSAGPGTRPLAGSGRGRLLAGLLTLLSLALFAGVLWDAGYARLYPAARFLHRPLPLLGLAALAALTLVLAGWLAARQPPAATALRSGALGCAVLLGVGTGAWGMSRTGFASTVERDSTLAVSPDGRYAVVRLDTRDWKDLPHTELRVRTRAGLLSHDADRELVTCRYERPRGRIDAEFVGERTVRVTLVDRPAVTVAFDGQLRPRHTVDICRPPDG
ncbi:hypothetical protein [Micromonospora sp. HUAS LYJ1]|uniref:hypothetical protein n=1 Tax=Micromonospora sp. HUAS LYJ1 TaxID=3061626 RepID=UPI0026737AC5|nr:hypothetical protein [Micromonospora sp. HUAS LYJ1]WKU07330.1 hypothetical protein Q2K16_09945 [Micromonospora sp. HUAS LYJ1]